MRVGESTQPLPSGALATDRVALLLLVLAMVYFVQAAARFISVPGLHYDEILFVNAATGEPTNGLFVSRRILGVPVMLMSYIGALKAYLYYPIFKLAGVSPATIRAPVIALTLLTLGVSYAVARYSFGRSLSALFVLTMAVDPALATLTTLDRGPVALMLLLKLAALLFGLRAIGTGSPRYFWGMSIACFLGVFDKLNFIWFVLALVVAGVVFFRTELAAAWRRDRTGVLLPLGLLAVFLGGVVVVLIIPQFGASQSAHPVSPVDRLHFVLDLYARTMNGQDVYSEITQSRLIAGSLTNAAVGIGMLGLGAATFRAAWVARGVSRMSLERRIPAAYLLIFLLIGVQIFMTRAAWGSHHMMMLYPFQFLIAFGGATALVGRAGGFAMAGVLIVSGMNVGVAYAQRFRPSAEYRAEWSPIVYDLIEYLNHQAPDAIVSVDWGIHNQVWALGTPRTRAISRDRWRRFQTPGDRESQERMFRTDFQGRRVLAILHGVGGDNMPPVRENFMVWTRSFGLTPRLERTFTSPAGTVIFEVYSVDGSRP
jgi:4-amino-4-deoxy-L-arabinose transferase-like glycosyltransferase